MKKKYKQRKFTRASNLSIAEVSHIERVYNAVNGTLKHYGEMVNIIENSKAEHCICCGEVIPEGRMICPTCESKAGTKWRN